MKHFVVPVGYYKRILKMWRLLNKEGYLFLTVIENGKPMIKVLADLVCREGTLPHAWIFSASTHVVEGVSSLLMTLIAIMRVDLNPLPNTLTPLITIPEFRILTYDSTDMQPFTMQEVFDRYCEQEDNGNISLRGRECSSPFLLG